MIHGTEQWTKREEIFTNRLKAILTHNANPSATYRRGVNQFTDRTKEERAKLLGAASGLLRAPASSFPQSFIHPKPHVRRTGQQAPASFDWRSVTPPILTAVKDQGHCGSCWAFASTATIESYAALSSPSRALPDLSPQQIVACAANPLQCGGFGGCAGGTPELAYSYVASAGGLSEIWAVPYTSYRGETNGTCPAVVPQGRGAVSLLGYSKFAPNADEIDIVTSIAFTGPLAVNVDATTWHDYESGVFSECSNQYVSR